MLVKLSSSAPHVSLGRKINKKELEETPTFPGGSSGRMVRIGRKHMDTGLVDACFQSAHAAITKSPQTGAALATFTPHSSGGWTVMSKVSLL